MADPKDNNQKDNQKDNPNTSSSNQNKGSGSDTVSAAKISAGTSVGSVGQSPPMPQGAGAGNPAQSGTLASHTSNPLGGQSASGKDQHSSSMPGQGGQAAARDNVSGGGGTSSTGGPASSSSGMGSSSKGQGSASGRQGQGAGSQGGTSDAMRQTADQARERAGEAYEDASEWVRDTYESASSWASGAMQGGGSGRMRGLADARRGVQTYVAQNPVMVGLVGLAAGLLLGALLPRTRREDQMFGGWADEVREQGLRYAHEMTQRGREFVEQGFTDDDPRFSKHESEFGAGPGADRTSPGANRH